MNYYDAQSFTCVVEWLDYVELALQLEHVFAQMQRKIRGSISE